MCVTCSCTPQLLFFVVERRNVGLNGTVLSISNWYAFILILFQHSHFPNKGSQGQEYISNSRYHCRVCFFFLFFVSSDIPGVLLLGCVEHADRKEAVCPCYGCSCSAADSKRRRIHTPSPECSFQTERRIKSKTRQPCHFCRCACIRSPHCPALCVVYLFFF